MLTQMKQDKVTVTTVGVATHGAPQDQALGNIAKATGGRFYNVKSAKALPAIYIKETRLVSQSFIYEKRFMPKLLFRAGPPRNCPTSCAALRLRADDAEGLALGRDADHGAADRRPGLPDPGLLALRPGQGGGLHQRRPAMHWDWTGVGAVGHVPQVLGAGSGLVVAGRGDRPADHDHGIPRRQGEGHGRRARREQPAVDRLDAAGGVTSPSPGGPTIARRKFGVLKFEQKNSGIYEAEFKADEAGSYFVNAQASRR